MARKGFLDMLPLNLAVLPWGILCGSLAIQRDFSVLEAILMPLIVFAGSAQLVATELIANNASLMTILFTTFICLLFLPSLYIVFNNGKPKELPASEHHFDVTPSKAK